MEFKSEINSLGAILSTTKDCDLYKILIDVTYVQ